MALASAAGALADPAGQSQGAFTDPQSPAAKQISDLFWITTWIAVGTSILVYGLMTFMLVKFRVKPGEAAAPEAVVKGEEGEADHPVHHGSNKLEAGYTAATAAVFGVLVVVSALTLFAVETPEPGDSMTLRLTGHQWFWEGYYPAENVTERATLSEFHVPVNKVVRLEITSVDVNHAVWIPNLGVKVDAVPSHINHFWFKAQKEDRYLLQCAEYCAGAHSTMHAVIVAESQAAFDAWVLAKRNAVPPPPPVLVTGGTVNITVTDSAITPQTPLDIEQGANVTLAVRNAGAAPHGFTMGAPYDSVSVASINAGESANLTVVFNQAVANGTYWSPVGTDRDAGLNGTFNVTATARVIDITLEQVAGSHGSWSISPENLDVTQGDVIRFRVHNNGSVDHNLRLDAPYAINTDFIHPGQSLLTQQIVVDKPVAYWCDVPGHRQLGMEGALHVAGAAAPQPSGPSSQVPGFGAELVAPALAVALCAAVYVRGGRRLR